MNLSMKNIDMFMKMAECAAQSSKAIRSKVGVIIVNNGRILSVGYNGTFPGDDNICEYEIYENFLLDDVTYTKNDGSSYQLRTKPDVLHAEFNAISKLARDGESAVNSTIFVTLSPCAECTKLMINVGIKEVVYLEEYRLHDDIYKKYGNKIKFTQYKGLL